MKGSVTLKSLAFGALIGCALVMLPCPAASAGIGGGIGIYIPTGGGHSREVGSDESFASFTVGKLVHELSVKKKNGGLAMEYRVRNGGEEPYTVEHKTGQIYDFAILDEKGRALWRSFDGAVFTDAISASTVPPGEEAVYKAEIKRKDFKKIKDGAVVVMAYILDTPYTLSAAIPEAKETSSGGAAVFGAVVVGNGSIGGW